MAKRKKQNKEVEELELLAQLVTAFKIIERIWWKELRNEPNNNEVRIRFAKYLTSRFGDIVHNYAERKE